MGDCSFTQHVFFLCVCVCVCVFNIRERDVLILFSFVWLLHGWCHMEFNIYIWNFYFFSHSVYTTHKKGKTKTYKSAQA